MWACTLYFDYRKDHSHKSPLEKTAPSRSTSPARNTRTLQHLLKLAVVGSALRNIKNGHFFTARREHFEGACAFNCALETYCASRCIAALNAMASSPETLLGSSFRLHGSHKAAARRVLAYLRFRHSPQASRPVSKRRIVIVLSPAGFIRVYCILRSRQNCKTAPRSHRSVSARKPTHATSPVLPLLPVSSIQGDPSAAIRQDAVYIALTLSPGQRRIRFGNWNALVISYPHRFSDDTRETPHRALFSSVDCEAPLVRKVLYVQVVLLSELFGRMFQSYLA